MQLTVQNLSTESIYRSMEYFQEDRDTDWVSYQPIVTCTLNNKINRIAKFSGGTTNEAYILGQKFYSSEPYDSNIINVVLPTTNPELTGRVDLLTQLSIDTPVYTNVDLNKYQIYSFGDNNVGRFLRIPKNCNQLKVLSFDIDNFNSITNPESYIFGSEDNNNYFYLKKKIGNLNSFVFGYGKTETNITLDIVDNGRHSFKLIQSDDTINSTIELHIDNVLKYTFSDELQNIPSKSLFIFGMNSIRLSNKPCLAIGRNLLATNSDKFMYVSNINQDLKDLYDPATKNDKIYFPIDFSIKTLMGAATGPFSLFAQTNIKTDEIYYVVHVENDTFKVVYMKSNYTVDLEKYEAIRKLQFEVNMKRSKVNTNTSDNTHNNIINNIEFKTFRKVTPSGTYKFRNNELVILKTKFTAIINAMSADTKVWEFGIITRKGHTPDIISVEVANTITVDIDTLSTVKGNSVRIINATEASTISDITNDYTNVNDKEQPHTSIIFVKESNSIETPSQVQLAVSHPVINALDSANTQQVVLTSQSVDGIPGSGILTVSSELYEYSFSIFQDIDKSYTDPVSSFSFNAHEIPLTDWFVNNDNIITQIKESIHESSFSFNAYEIPLTDFFVNNDNIITQIKESIHETSFSFNAQSIPIQSMTYNDNIISLSKITENSFSFNIKQTNDYSNVKNGYNIDTVYNVTTTDSGNVNLNGITIIKLQSAEESEAGTTSTSIYNADKNYSSLINNINTNRDSFGDYKNSAMYSKTRNIITSNTKVSIFDASLKMDNINMVYDSVPRMITANNIKIYDNTSVLSKLDNINMLYDSVPNISTVISNKLYDANNINDFNLDKLNALNNDTTSIITLNNTSVITDIDLDSGSSLLNKDNSSIVSPAIQLNPGVILV